MVDYPIGARNARHMRDGIGFDAVACVGTDMYTNLSQACMAGQGRHIKVLKNCEVTTSITINTAGTTIDLNHNTVVFRSPHHADDVTPVGADTKDDTVSAPFLTITAPGISIQNGRLAVLSGARQAISLKRGIHKPEVLLDNVGLAYDGTGFALCAMDGIALLQDSRIESSGKGICLLTSNTRVGVIDTRIIAQDHAMVIEDGRLFAANSSIAAREADAAVVTGGFLGAYASDLSADHGSAINCSMAVGGTVPPSIRLCECSEVTSVHGNGLMLEGGNAVVLRSMVRSIHSVAIKMGKVDSFVPTRLSLVGGTMVSSWRDRGIQRISGKLYINNSHVESVYGPETHLCDTYDSDIEYYPLDLAEPMLQ